MKRGINGTKTLYNVATNAIKYHPKPMAMPIEAANHMLAAVVRFFIFSLLPFRIIPAPKKPMPLTTCAAIRAGELGSIWTESAVNIIEPPMTKECVLMPAGLPRNSRSMPIIIPADNEAKSFQTNAISSAVNIQNCMVG